jgi:hypothetical protein
MSELQWTKAPRQSRSRQSRVLRDAARLAPLFSDERDRIEAAWFANPPASGAAFAEGTARLERWITRVENADVADVRPLLARRYWARQSGRLAGASL